MKHSIKWSSLLLAGVLLSSSSISWAESERPTFTLTPFGGYRANGSIPLNDPNYSKVELADDPVFGLAAGMEVPKGLVEVMWTHQSSNAQVIPTSTGGAPLESFHVDSDQFHFNGLYYPPDFHSYQPYVLAGVGMTRYEPTGNFSAADRFSWALGGGTMVPLNRALALRFEAKWDPALVSSSGSVFCNSATGQCLATSSGSVLSQFDFTAGLTLKI